MARMKRADIVIGIDPDVEMSGVARVDVAKGTAWADTLPLPLLLDYVAGVALDSAVTVVVVVEASWTSSHNWHVRPCGGARSNQEERDALLLAWDHAGLPMRIMRKK